jgi:hypothetical protein
MEDTEQLEIQNKCGEEAMMEDTERLKTQNNNSEEGWSLSY